MRFYYVFEFQLKLPSDNKINMIAYQALGCTVASIYPYGGVADHVFYDEGKEMKNFFDGKCESAKQNEKSFINLIKTLYD